MIPFLLFACGGDSTGGPDAGGGLDLDDTPDVVPGVPGGETGEGSDHTPPDWPDAPIGGEPRVPDVIVDCAGAGDFTTIAEAVAASAPGTKIGLRPCAYAEDVDFGGKSLDIFGMEGSAVTFIGTGRSPGVTAVHGESLGTRLAGVTVQSSHGGAASGLRATSAVLALEDVVFTGGEEPYAVLFAQGSFLDLVDVTISGNRARPDGATIILDNGSFVARRLTVACDAGMYGIDLHNASLLLDSQIACGETAAIFVDGGELHVRRSTVVSPGVAVFAEDDDDTRNERLWLHSSAFVGGTTGVHALYTQVRANNDVFWGGAVGLDLQYVNAESYVRASAMRGGSCGLRTDGAAYDLAWNAVEGTGGGCASPGIAGIVGDLGFVDAPEDFHLAAGSALIDAGDPDGDRVDPDGTRNDVGMYGGPEGEGER